jgi:hypothetical protein
MKIKRKSFVIKIDTPEQIFYETISDRPPMARIMQIRNDGWLVVQEDDITHVIPYHSIAGFEIKEVK